MERLQAMMTFAKVVETRSFSAAARELGTSKSFVSKQVGMLEASLGVRLLNRTTRRLSPTEVGAAFHEHCARIASEAQAAQDEVTRMRTAPSGTLKLSAPVSFATYQLAPALDEFMRRHPEVRIDLDASDRPVDLADEGFDLALRISSRPAPGLVARRIVGLAWLTCASPAYLARHGAPTLPQDLSGHNCLTYYGQPASIAWDFTVNRREFVFSPRGNVRVNHAALLHQMALAGVGIIQMPDYVVADDLREGRLVTLLDEFRGASEFALYAVYLPNRYLLPKVRAFIDFVLERFGEDARAAREAASASAAGSDAAPPVAGDARARGSAERPTAARRRLRYSPGS